MIRTLVVADSGDVLADLTATLQAIDSVVIAGYASGRTPVGAIARATRPDVVLVDQMRWPGLALARIAELRAEAPQAAVVGLSASGDQEWVVDGLRAGACAVVPRDMGVATLARVLSEVLGTAAWPNGTSPNEERRVGMTWQSRAVA